MGRVKNKRRTTMIRKILDLFFRHRSADASARPGMRFVDLGLPSGTLWAESDVKEPTMAGCSLPSYAQIHELIVCCHFYIGSGSDGRKYYCAKGPSEQFVFFPIEDYEGTPGPSGCCWCADSVGEKFRYFMLLSEDTITIGAGQSDLKFPYRMVKSSSC